MQGGPQYMQHLGHMMGSLSRDTPEDAQDKLDTILQIAKRGGAMHLGDLSERMGDVALKMLKEKVDSANPRIAKKERRKSSDERSPSPVRDKKLKIVISCRDGDTSTTDDANLLEKIRNPLQANANKKLARKGRGVQAQVLVLCKNDMHEAAEMLKEGTPPALKLGAF